MFTGIVEEMGRVAAIESSERSARLTITAASVLEGTSLGDSIAVAGVCLTVVDLTGATFTADVMRETLERTRLGSLKPGVAVNLERAVRADARLGGHIVTGHVDALGTVVAHTPGENWNTLVIEVPEPIARHLAPQGSVAVEGVSLTIAEASARRFGVGLIPATLAATTLGSLAAGDRVNIETDILAKYLARLMGLDDGEARPARWSQAFGEGGPRVVGQAQADPAGLDDAEVAA
jgi:riboflavin synthase